MLAELVKIFDDQEALPVEIPEVRDSILAMGFQDEIVIAGQPMPTGKLWGAIYQYTRRPMVYGEPNRCTVVAYNSNLPVDLQRVVCCKELIHIFDKEPEKTNNQEELDEFIEKLLGPASTDDFGLADLMVATDRFAIYQTIPVLFPLRTRNDCARAVAEGRASVEQVADLACLPASFVRLGLADGWEELRELLLDC